MRRYVNFVLIVVILVVVAGCSRFARVEGTKYRAFDPELSIVAGSRLETGPLTLEGAAGNRWNEEEGFVPIVEGGAGLDGRGWSAFIVITADVEDPKRTYILIFAVETDL